MEMFACPSISCTIFGWVTLDKRSVAHVCLRSWNLMRGKSARSRSGLNERYVRLPTSTGVPTVEVNTKLVSCHKEPALVRSPFCDALWPSKATTAVAVSLTTRALPRLGAEKESPSLVRVNCRRTCKRERLLGDV